MAYFVVTNKNNVNKFYLTDTCNKPRIAVKQGTKINYIPMRTALTTVMKEELIPIPSLQYEDSVYEEEITGRDYTGTSLSNGFTAVRYFPIDFDFRYGFKDIDRTTATMTETYSQSMIIKDESNISDMYNSIGINIKNRYFFEDYLGTTNYRANVYNTYWTGQTFKHPQELKYTRKSIYGYFNLSYNTDYEISFSEYETYKTGFRTHFVGTFVTSLWSNPQALQAFVSMGSQRFESTYKVSIGTKTFKVTSVKTSEMYYTSPQLLGAQTYIYKRVYKANKRDPIDLYSAKMSLTRIAPGYDDGLTYQNDFYAGRFDSNGDNFGNSYNYGIHKVTLTVQTWI